MGASKDRRDGLEPALDALHEVRSRGVDLAEVIGAYLLRGVVSLRRRPLKLYQMTQEWAPFAGAVTADPLPTMDEVRRRVRIIVGNPSLDFPREGVLPMLPAPETVVLVSPIFLLIFPLFELSFEFSACS